MGRRADHGTLGSATSGLFELSAKVGNLFFEPAGHDCQGMMCAWRNGGLGDDLLLLQSHVGLLHRVDLLTNQLHFVDLGLNCGIC